MFNLKTYVKMGKFDEVGAVKALKAKNISVNSVSKTIKIPASANVGNATNAKIDFLCNLLQTFSLLDNQIHIGL